MKRLIATTLAAALVAGLATSVVGAQTTGSSTPAAAKQTTPKPPATKPAAMKPVDINSATKAQLTAIPGIDATIADNIIKGRPFKTKAELKTKNIVTAAVYDKISTKIVATQPKK